MAEQAWRRGIAIEINAFDEQVGRDHGVAIRQGTDYGRIVSDPGNQAR